MALIKTVCGLTPRWGEDCYFSENATIVGDVTMGDQCTVWFNAVVRGDVNYIRIGNRVNIQDGSCLHTLYQKAAIEIGDDVTIGHNVTLHGCTIKNCALIGMGATVLDRRGHHCCRSTRAVEHQGGRRRTMGRSACKVHKKSRSRTSQGTQPRHCKPLYHVQGLV